MICTPTTAWGHSSSVCFSQPQCCHCLFHICCVNAGVRGTPDGDPPVPEVEFKHSKLLSEMLVVESGCVRSQVYNEVEINCHMECSVYYRKSSFKMC